VESEVVKIDLFFDLAKWEIRENLLNNRVYGSYRDVWFNFLQNFEMKLDWNGYGVVSVGYGRLLKSSLKEVLRARMSIFNATKTAKSKKR
jgi:hypothetical protein